jgi:FkbH-like protein
MVQLLITSDTTTSLIANALKKRLREDFADREFAVIDGDYNSWFHQVFQENSAFKTKKPDYWIQVWSPRQLTDSPFIKDQLNAFLEKLKNEHSHTRVIATTFVVDPIMPLPLHQHFVVEELAQELNETLKEFAKNNSFFSLLNLQSFFTTYGIKAISDVRFEALARTYFSPQGTELLANFLLRGLNSLLKIPKKVLVLDLDNTLWGGILGEDGFDNLEIGSEGSGLLFTRFQKALLSLKENGVLLALCSKNNENEVLNVFHTHTGMILKLEDFACYKINWQSKAENLVEMSKELNLGLDSFVFFDDSAFERENVKKLAPEVLVIDVPNDPSAYVETLFQNFSFDSFAVTEEDKKKTIFYKEEQKRKDLKNKSFSLENFYESLEMNAKLSKALEIHFERTFQLIGKTNQFNLTTRRYQEGELRSLLLNKDYQILVLEVQDRMGESGITGVVIIKKNPNNWEVENLLLSCRIIGRTIEFALLRTISEMAKNAGAKSLAFHFIPTERNTVAATFLKESGLELISDGLSQIWKLDLINPKNPLPKDYVAMTSDS